MKWLKKIFGTKEKSKDETPLLPIKDEEHQSVPLEENVMDIVQPEEPIAPTLERQELNLNDTIENVVGSNDKKIPEPIMFTSIANRNLMNEILKEKLSKNKKPKKQAKKKDNRNPDDDKKSWPNSNNFTL